MMAGLSLAEIINVGFAVFVAVFLLTRLDRTLLALNETIIQLSKIVENSSSRGDETKAEVIKQTDILNNHSQHLKKIGDELGKVPKRGEHKKYE